MADTMAEPGAPMPVFTIYNMPPQPALWDKVGIFYVSFCAIWSTLVFSGMIFCLFNRHVPALRHRGLPLSFAAITFLHSYWCLAQVTYPIGRTMSVVLAYDIQYFFMGIYFPLGIALFQASNTRFLHVARRQRQFIEGGQPPQECCNGGSSSWLCRLRNVPWMTRFFVLIGVGMVFQVMLTIGMWFACMKYHPTYGIPGTEIIGDTLEQQIIELGRGWEWWPSVLWQVIWTWIVAPILIWRAWGLRDTMGWRTQTIGCCLSSLHATPMFLIASYLPAFNTVNMYFHSSQWIHLSIFMFEIFTVFIPVFQVIKHHILTRRAASLNAKWETESMTTTVTNNSVLHSNNWKHSSPNPGSSSNLSAAEKGVPEAGVETLDFADEAFGERLHTMSALEYVLAENPIPLQDFSALNDFSGENIAFLRRAAEWKLVWEAKVDSSGDIADAVGEHTRLDMFNRALAIYTTFVSPVYADFPLNLSSRALTDLSTIFSSPAQSVHGDASSNPATPFDSFPLPSSSSSGGDGAWYSGSVPDDFSASVFNDAIGHVKYLVLTNTWPKFVAEMQQRRRRSSETSGDRSEFTATSELSLASRLSNQVVHALRSLLRRY